MSCAHRFTVEQGSPNYVHKASSGHPTHCTTNELNCNNIDYRLSGLQKIEHSVNWAESFRNNCHEHRALFLFPT